MGVTGVVVDCGSGHTSITSYSYSGSRGPESLVQCGKTWLKHSGDGGNLPLTDVIPGTLGTSFIGESLAERVAEFIQVLREALEHPPADSPAESAWPDILLIGGTGGMRSAVEEGRLSESAIESIRTMIVAAFDSDVQLVKFEVITGDQEAIWELHTAQIIWSRESAAMFPDDSCHNANATPADIGLFSGGGKSMQLAQRGSAMSFPFSTFPKELEERSGAAPDAWLDSEKWATYFADPLVAKVTEAAAVHQKFNGCFVGTAMNHRAAMFSEISEKPITAAAAVEALQASLPQFIQREGELYDKMIATHKPGSSYPLERITAMHTFRLVTVLAEMFDPSAKLFFARNGQDAAGNQQDIECTVGAFAEEARSLAAQSE